MTWLPVWAILISSAVAASGLQARDAIRIPAGRFTPLFGLESTQKDLPVRAFHLDRYQVTNRKFREFVKRHPEWSKAKVTSMFADGSYLKHLKNAKPDQPVVFVSWYAAQAYCEDKGGRLPSVLEWEYAADTSQNGVKDPELTARILAWYGKPFRLETLPAVQSTPAGPRGVHGLHGVVWEWTSDFNSVFVSGDNRQDGDKVQNLFCGNSSTGSSTREDYAAFMRYAMRSSLQAEFAIMNVGFRCAYDAPEMEKSP